MAIIFSVSLSCHTGFVAVEKTAKRVSSKCFVLNKFDMFYEKILHHKSVGVSRTFPVLCAILRLNEAKNVLEKT